MPEEFEITMRVCAQDPEALFSALASDRLVGPYELVPEETSVFHDRYFDTDRNDLMKRGFALRVRTEGGRSLLCLKGRERIHERGGVHRLEIEGAWSPDTLDQILQAAGITTGESPVFHGEDPVKTLYDRGFSVIQSRGTLRTRLIAFTAKGSSDRVVGEMDLDKVSYRVDERVFIHYEVEIEAASPDSQEAAAGLASLLRKVFPDALCSWDHNKLITGYALETLAKQGLISPPPVGEQIISVQWYEMIEDWIGKHSDNLEKMQNGL